MLKIYSIIFFLLLTPLNANAEGFIPNAKLVGEGKLKYFVWHIYDASLYAEGEFSFDKPFYLTLNYKRNLDGEKIADRSAEEIRGLSFKDEVKLAGWHSQMRDIFPDVNDGSTLTGVYQPNKLTEFYYGDQLVGTIKDPEFGKWFFGIWLNENTSEPELRKQLLGA